MSTSNAVLVGLPGWEWYVDGVREWSQTDSSFSWDSTGKQPGQYLVSVAVVYAGVKYSGSLRVTVIY